MNNKVTLGKIELPRAEITFTATALSCGDGKLSKTLLNAYMNRLKPESERAAPDKRGCEAMFARAFVQGDMERDFPLIARDFLKHEAANLERCKDLSYMRGTPQYSSLQCCWPHVLIHAMYTGAKNGSEYCRALIKYLFRTYYPKLYKTFKRFQKFSMDDVLSLSDVDNNGGSDPDLIYILLCMAEIFDVRLDRSCDVLFLFAEDTNHQKSLEYDIEFFEIEDNLFTECRKQIQELFPGDSSKIAQKQIKSDKFTKKALEYCGYPYTLLHFSREEHVDYELDLTRTLAILKTVYTNREFSAQEILQYSNLLNVIMAFADTTRVCYESMIDVLGLGDDTFYNEDGTLFDPDKIIVQKPSDAGQPTETVRVTAPPKPNNAEEYSQEALLKEIEILRDKLRTKENESKHLREKLHEANRQLKEQGVLIREAEQNRQELAALRGHLYHFTEYDKEVETKEKNEIIQKLGTKRVTIVGGHTNWVQKIKKLFPDWNYISPNVSSSNISQWVSNAEFVYFFTDTLSHSVYGTFIQMVREQDIPFGYIHGVNIDANIRQMWEEIGD